MVIKKDQEAELLCCFDRLGKFFENMKIDKEDTIFLAQATTPLLRHSDIEQAYEQYGQSGADSLLSLKSRL